MIIFKFTNLIEDFNVVTVHLLHPLPLLTVLVPELLYLCLLVIQTQSLLADLNVKCKFLFIKSCRLEVKEVALLLEQILLLFQSLFDLAFRAQHFFFE